MTSSRSARAWDGWVSWLSGLIREPLLERATVALIALASAAGLTAQLSAGGPPASYVALALTLGGCILSRWLLWPGILLAITGPPVSYTHLTLPTSDLV